MDSRKLPLFYNDSWKNACRHQQRQDLRVVLLLVALLVATLAIMDWLRAPHLPTDFADRPLYTIDGKAVTLAELSAKKPLLIYVWSGTCGVCEYASRNVQRLRASGGNVLTVTLNSGDDIRIIRLLRGRHLTQPIVNDPQGEMVAEWGLNVMPTLIVVSKGQVVLSTSGWTSDTGMRLRLWWASKWYR
ncbi:redoxin family protein [Erwinia sp. 9145]|uniref:redoxin family protein n=1 Tax=Erwinia sp. 9145 TaxID=1500895 RepID=UPI00068E18A5|nr:redoxin family protein [Erwinia sp. 9145]